MKLSRNTIIVSNANNDGCIMANTYTRSVVKLNAECYSAIKMNNFEQLPNDMKEALYERGFIVPKYLDEDLFLKYLSVRQQFCDNVLSTYLMYSTACNFACQYCYEQGQTHPQIMSKQNVETLIKWYGKKFEFESINECQIILFGGEPLLFKDFFINFLERIKVLTDNHKIKLVTKIITNGYLLDNMFIEKLSQFGLDEIQITIDGLANEHDRLRPLRNGGKTFNTIMSNILYNSRRFINIKFLCRISFNKSNYQNISELLKFLHREDPKHHIIPYFAHITQTYSQYGIPCSFCSQNVYTDDTELANCYSYLWGLAKTLGYETPAFHTFGPCMFYSANGYVITPSGDLYKCLNMVGVDEHIAGNINSYIHNTNYYYSVLHSSNISYCLRTDCPYVPICCDGCVIESWLKYNDYSKICCKRSFMDLIHERLLTIKYDIKTSETD